MTEQQGILSENLKMNRKQRLQHIQGQTHWDMIIIGGGITGAGILKLASQLKL